MGQGTRDYLTSLIVSLYFTKLTKECHVYIFLRQESHGSTSDACLLLHSHDSCSFLSAIFKRQPVQGYVSAFIRETYSVPVSYELTIWWFQISKPLEFNLLPVFFCWFYGKNEESLCSGFLLPVYDLVAISTRQVFHITPIFEATNLTAIRIPHRVKHTYLVNMMWLIPYVTLTHSTIFFKTK